jgi:hypothetical protein
MFLRYLAMMVWYQHGQCLLALGSEVHSVRRLGGREPRSQGVVTVIGAAEEIPQMHPCSPLPHFYHRELRQGTQQERIKGVQQIGLCGNRGHVVVRGGV